MEPWTFPTDPLELWSSLDTRKQEEIIIGCAACAKANRAPYLIRAIARKLNSRESTVRNWPIERLSVYLTEMSKSGTFLEKDIFFCYCVDVKSALNNDWLDVIGGVTEGLDGPVPPDCAERCIAKMLHVYPLDDVRLVAQILNLLKPSIWGRIPETDFRKVEELMAKTESVPGPAVDGNHDILASAEDADAAGNVGEPFAIEIEQLKRQFEAAAGDFTEMANHLNAGIIPDTPSLGNVESLIERFHGLRECISERMANLGLSEISSDVASLAILSAAVSEIERAEAVRSDIRKQTDSAVRLLGQIQRIITHNGREFTALNEVYRSAADLQAEIKNLDSPDFPPEIADQFKMLEAILRMVTGAGDSDEDSAFADRIAATFGAAFLFALGKGAFILDDSDAAPAAQKSPDSASHQQDSLEIESIQAVPEEEPYAAASEERGVEENSIDIPAPETIAEVDEEVRFVTVSPAGGAEEQLQEEDMEIPAGEDESSALFSCIEGETSSTLARKLLNSHGSASTEECERLVWLAIGEQNYSAAYYLAETALKNSEDATLSLFSLRIRAMMLGQSIRTPMGSIADQLKSDYSAIAVVRDGSDYQCRAFRLMLIASALCPALLAPDTNAKAILEFGAKGLSGMERLHWLCAQLTNYANLRMPLDARELEYIDSSVSNEQNLAAFREQVQEWWDRARQYSFHYAAAMRLWKLWLGPNELIGRMIEPILRNDISRLADQKEAVMSLASDLKIRDEIASEEKRLRGLGFAGKINWSALNVFTRHVQEAVDQAERWIAMQQHIVPGHLNSRKQRLLDLRMNLDSGQSGVREELESAIASAQDMRVVAALECCLFAFENLMALIHPKSSRLLPEPQVKYLLSSSLLAVPGLPMNEAWEPTTLNADELQKLVISVLADSTTANIDNAAGLVAQDHRILEAVDRIIEYLNWEGNHPQLLDEITSLQAEHQKQCQDALRRQIDDCRKEIEKGVSLGLVREVDRIDHVSKVDHIAGRIDSIRNFAAEEEVLDGIYAAINESRRRQVEQVMERIESEKIAKDTPAYARIMAVLKRDDVDTAIEYIDLTVHGDTLPDQAEVQDSLAEFYPKSASAIDTYLSLAPQRFDSFIGNLKEQRGIAGFELKQVAGAQIQSGIAMLEAWESLKRARCANRAHLTTLFEKIGVKVKKITESEGTSKAFASLDIVPLRHRDQCPVPYFGSSCNGHYRVICIWDRPTDQEIISDVQQGRQGPPTIVLYFGRLSEQKRRNIAQLGRDDNLSFLLIDELLICYLCGERGSRLPVMFDCTLPFTCISPYITASSNVPPEMFYGRRVERTQIIDPMGSCFVYGGRQLGKTALLLSIRDDFHSPAEHHIALWIDLKAYADDIWTVLCREFKNLSEPTLPIGDVRTRDSLLAKLKAWLQADDRRRILLLLDEADRFLEQDAESGFERTRSIKGLMEQTNRRFKVVFAGLHNVQRTTKLENHPLAHFGQPICVGPLLDNGDWKEAKALIEKPFWSLGFRFESPDLVTRILSRTNYYPSLIQLYCNQIYRNLRLDSATFRNGPPFRIAAKHVDGAYVSGQFSRELQEKFQLTLNLDPRYFVLAHIIALNSADGPSDSMSIGEIREWAVTLWQPGFVDADAEEDFRALLDEMVGLGILREVGGRFALRTPNLLSLLGNRDQIAGSLNQSTKGVPPQKYKASFYRRRDSKDNGRRSPLSDLQEGELRREQDSVTILFGTQAAGLDEVTHFLRQTFGAAHFFECELSITDRNEFRKYLDEIRDRNDSGTSLILVHKSPWTEAWIDEAVNKRKGIRKFTSIVFLAGPAAAWSFIHGDSRLEELAAQRKINTMSLRPWHSSALREWLGDCGIGANTDAEEAEIGAVTGRWPLILQEFYRAKADENLQWKDALKQIHERLLNKSQRRKYVEAFGLDVQIPYQVLHEFAELKGSARIDDLTELMSHFEGPLIANTIKWADRLGLVRQIANGEWELDSVVIDLLLGGA